VLKKPLWEAMPTDTEAETELEFPSDKCWLSEAERLSEVIPRDE
jgi:hypothetical protein